MDARQVSILQPLNLPQKKNMSSSLSSSSSQSEEDVSPVHGKRLKSTPRTPLSPQEPFPEIAASKPHRSGSSVRFEGLKVTAEDENQSVYRRLPSNPIGLYANLDSDEATKILLQSPSQLVDRIESLENQLRNLDLSKQSISWDKGDESSERTGLSTEIQWMTWQEYLEDASKATNILEVLLEKPHTNSRRKSVVPQPTIEAQRGFSSRSSGSPYKNIERIRIRSFHIINALQLITEQTFTSSSRLIIHRPFKVLLFYHDHIIDYLKELEHNFSENTRCGLGEHCHGFVNLGESNINPPNPRSRRSSNVRKGSLDDPILSPKSTSSPSTAEDECRHEASEELLAQAEAITHLRILTKFMQEDMEGIFARHQLLRSSQADKIGFQDLWHLFMAGDILVANGELSGGKGLELYQVSILPAADVFSSRRPVKEISTRTEGSHQLVESVYKEEVVSAMSVFTVDVFYFDFDGHNFGPVERRMHLVSYEGEKNIVHLPLYPLRFHKEADQIQATMLRRGMMFRELSATNVYPHREYNGLSAGEPQEQASHPSGFSPVNEVQCADSFTFIRLTAKSLSTLPWPTKNTQRTRQSSDLGRGSKTTQG